MGTWRGCFSTNSSAVRNVRRTQSLIEEITDLGERFMVALIILVMSCVLIIVSFFFPDVQVIVLTMVAGWVGAVIGFYFGKSNGQKK